MGNDLSSLGGPIDPFYCSPQLKFKTGTKSACIPIPDAPKHAKFESLLAVPGIKSQIFAQIDSELLLNGIMEGATDKKILLEGMENRYQRMDDEAKDDLRKRIDRFHKCIHAGINVDVHEALAMFEDELGLSMEFEATPLLLAFQKRLGCVRGLLKYVEQEQKQHGVMLLTKLSHHEDVVSEEVSETALSIEPQQRSLATAVTKSITSSPPQLRMLTSLKGMGLSYLRLLPNILRAQPSEAEQQLVVQPVLQLFDDICSGEDMDLFPCWARAKKSLRSDEMVMLGRDASVSGAAGNSLNGNSISRIYDGLTETFWQCGPGCVGGNFTVIFKEAKDISDLCFYWIPDYLKFPNGTTDVGAPKRVAIFVRQIQHHEGGEASMAEPAFRIITTFEPAKVYNKTNCWIHQIPLNLKLVSMIKVVFSAKECIGNNLGCCRLYNFECIRGKEQVVSLVSQQTHAAFGELNDSILAVSNLPPLRDRALDSMFSLVRTSASLRICLKLIETIWQKECTVFQTGYTDALLRLIDAIRSQDVQLRVLLNEQYWNVPIEQSNVVFESSSCVIYKNTNRRLVSIPATQKSGIAALNSPTNVQENVEFDFEVTRLSQGAGGSDIYLGLGQYSKVQKEVLRNGINGSGVRGNVWVIHCQTGRLISSNNGNEMQPTNSLSRVKPIKQGDEISFIYDPLRSMLGLKINGDYQGVIFEQLPTNLFPIVIFDGSNCSEEDQVSIHPYTPCILCKSYRTNKVSTTSFHSKSKIQPLSLPEPIDVEAAKQSGLSLEFFLNRLHSLCEAKAIELCSYERRNIASDWALDHPFCIEVTEDTLSLIHQLISRQLEYLAECAVKELARNYSLIILHMTRILSLQLMSLRYAKATVPDVNDNSSSGNALIKKISVLLNTLMSFPDVGNEQLLDDCIGVWEEIRISAAKAFSYGSEIFLATAVDIISVTVKVMEHVSMDEQLLSNTAPQSWRLLLLSMLLDRFLEISVVRGLIAFAADSSDNLSIFRNLLNLLFSLVVRVIEFSIHESNDGGNHRCWRAIYERVVSFCIRFQEHLIAEIISCKEDALLLQLMTDYCSCLFNTMGRIFNGCCEEIDIRNGKARQIFKLVQLLLLSLCNYFAKQEHRKYCTTILPLLVGLFSSVSAATSDFIQTDRARELLYRTFYRTPAAQQSTSSSPAWRVLSNARFEEPTQSGFNITHDGMMYVSVQSSNTCSYVPIKFSANQRAAWEFYLESDASGDECSVFGAVRMPLNSRCYSSSPDMWMRRSYNGYMYANGSSVSGRSMPKIHQGDTVRIEFDGKAGILYYSVNGEELKEGFTGIVDDIYPACGSYRSNVSIKLLKVEVYELVTTGVQLTEVFDTYKTERVPSSAISWFTDDEECDEVVLVDEKSLSQFTIIDPSSEGKKKTSPFKRWTTLRGTRGAYSGQHQWSFEFLEQPLGESFAIGLHFGRHVDVEKRLASSNSEACAAAWYSDGSLWFNGNKVSDGFGVNFLPLKKYSVVSMEFDHEAGTLAYLVNGQWVGVAFGSEGTNTAAVVSFPKVSNENEIFFPAASIVSSQQSLKITSSGFHGSVLLPYSLDLKMTLVSVISRMSCAMLIGPAVDTKEAALIPWLTSALMIGGMENDTESFSNISDWRVMFDKACVQLRSPLSVTINDNHRENVVGDASLEANASIKSAARGLENTSSRTALVCQNLIQVLACGDFTSKDVTTNSSLDDATGLLKWFDSIDPEPSFLKQAMQRQGCYSFPIVEGPFIACLLKHSGLCTEAVQIMKALAQQKQIHIEPSKAMKCMWQKVKHLRNFLRKQRQIFFSLDDEEASNEAEVDGRNIRHEDEPNEISPGDERSSTVRERSRIASVGHEEMNDDDDNCSSKEDVEQCFVEAGAESLAEESPLYYGEDIYWTAQDTNCRSSSTNGNYCVVTAVGWDANNELLFVRLHAFGEERNGYLPSAKKSFLFVNESNKLTASDSLFTIEMKTEAKGCLRYDLSSIPQIEKELEFCYGEKGGYTKIKLENAKLKASEAAVLAADGQSNAAVGETCSEGIAASLPERPSRKALNSLCEKLAEKAKLLLQLNPASFATNFEEEESKQMLRNLARKYSGRFSLFKTGDGFNKSAWRTQHQWKKLIDFLRVHTASSGNYMRQVDSSDHHSSGSLRGYMHGMDSAASLSPVLSNTFDAAVSSSHVAAGDTPQQSFSFIAEKIPSLNRPEFIEETSSPDYSHRDASDGSDWFSNERDDQELDPINAALQMCTIFVTSDDSKLRMTDFQEIFHRRSARAYQRAFGFQALSAMLGTPSFIQDPLLVHTLITFVKPSLSSDLSYLMHDNELLPEEEQIERVLLQNRGRFHYLSNLEGSSTLWKTRVQSAFANLWTELSEVLVDYITSWEAQSIDACAGHSDTTNIAMRTSPSDSQEQLRTIPRAEFYSREVSVPSSIILPSGNAHIFLLPIYAILDMFALHFSGRDNGWIHQSAALPLLLKVLSANYMERIARVRREFIQKVQDNLDEKVGENGIDGLETIQRIWHPDFVSSNLLSGALSSQRLLLHVKYAARQHYLYDDKTQEIIEFIQKQQTSRSSFNVTAMMKWYIPTYTTIEELCDKKEQIIEQKKTEKKSKVASAKAEIQKEIAAYLASCGGTFDAERIGTPIALQGFNMEAVLANSGNSTPCCVFGSDAVFNGDDADFTNTGNGNYFEITILAIGSKEISIGLADRDSFPLTGSTVGELGSFGLHGNNGRRYGSNSTSQSWSAWTEGDVIGCGIDLTRRSIFFTRNGSFLGDGFENIHLSSKLWPVVGFKNRQKHRECVRINFGVEPFKYTCSQSESINQSIVYVHSAALKERRARETGQQVHPEITLARRIKEILMSNKEDAEKRSAEIQSQSTSNAMLFACDCVHSEHQQLQMRAALLLRFILCLSVSQQHSTTNHEDTNSIQESSNAVAAVGAASSLSPPGLIAEVSSYGTPKAVTSEDTAALQVDVVSSILHELHLAALYLSQRRIMDSAVGVAELRDDADDFTGAESAINNRRDMSFFDIHNNFIRKKTEAGAMNLNPELGAADATGDRVAAVLSSFEVEALVEQHLLTLQTLLPLSEIIHREMQAKRSIRSLLLLSNIVAGRSRLKALQILKSVLPVTSPESVEEAMPQSFQDQLLSVESIIAARLPSLNRKRNNRHLDSVIKHFMISAAECYFSGPLLLNQENRTSSTAQTLCWNSFVRVSTYQGSQGLASGCGESLMQHSSVVVELLQRLFESPQWTELCACCVTDVFRNANRVLESENSLIVGKEDTTGMFAMELACIACFTLVGLDILRPGCVVETGEGKAILVEYSSSDDQVSFALTTKLSNISRNPFNCSKHVIEEHVSTVHAVRTMTAVDLSDLSQPLLHEVSTISNLCLKSLKEKRGFNFCSIVSHRSLPVVAATVLQTLSELLFYQESDILNHIQDYGIIPSIIQMALTPIDLPFTVTKNQITKMRSSLHALALEEYIGQSLTNAVLRYSVPGMVNSPVDATDLPISPLDGECNDGSVMSSSPMDECGTRSTPLLTINASFEAQCMNVASELSCEYGTTPQICAMYLQFYNMDVRRTRLSLERCFRPMPSVAPDELISIMQVPSTAISMNAEEVSFSDANLLSQVEHAAPISSEGRQLQTNGTMGDCRYNTLPRRTYHRVEEYLQCSGYIVSGNGELRKVTKDGQVGDDCLLLVESDADGYDESEYCSGKVQRVMIRDIRVIKKVDPKTSNESEVYCTSYDTHSAEHGVATIGLLTDFEHSHRVITEVYGTPVHHLVDHRNAMERSTAIFSCRTIASRLIASSNVNLLLDTETIADWPMLMKLIDSSSCSANNAIKDGAADVAATLCNALLSRAFSIQTANVNDELAGSAVSASNVKDCLLNSMIADVESNFERLACTGLNQLLYPCKSVGTVASETAGTVIDCGAPEAIVDASLKNEKMSAALEDEKVSSIQLSTPHPYPAPYDWQGRLKIPSTWDGISIQFHEKSETSSEQTYLRLFRTAEDMLTDSRAIHYFSGPSHASVGSATSFKSVFLNNCRDLYFRFFVPANGECRALSLRSLDEALLVSNRICSLLQGPAAPVAPVGLGDADTLFNLFDTEYGKQVDDGVETETHVALSTIPEFIRSGTWHFEVTVQTHSEETSECSSSKINGSVGIFSKAGYDEEIMPPTSAAVPAHAIVMTSSGAVYVNGNETVPAAQERRWKLDDIISCVFSFSNDGSSPQVCFAVNGRWMDGIAGDLIDGGGWKPGISLTGSTSSLRMNFGEEEFSFPPDETVLRQLHATCIASDGIEMLSLDGDKAGSEVLSAKCNPVIRQPIEAGIQSAGWGFEMLISPLSMLNMCSCRQFDLVWHSKMSGVSSADVSVPIWVWRPKSSIDGFASCGDLVTTSGFAPRRAFLVDERQCQPPIDWKLVFQHTKAKLTVWRAEPPEGYVSLGDVIMKSSSSSPLNVASFPFLCVPLWAVQETKTDRFLGSIAKCEGPHSPTCSLWAINHGLGFFRGSPAVQRWLTVPMRTLVPSNYQCPDGVGPSYELRVAGVGSVLDGECGAEQELVQLPSLSWAGKLLGGLLNCSSARSAAVKSGIFSKIVRYLQSSIAPSATNALPALIQLIRAAQAEGVSLPLHEVKALCAAILQNAVDWCKSNGDKDAIPPSYMNLIDLVVEIQMAQILDGMTQRSKLEDSKVEAVRFELATAEIDSAGSEEGEIVHEEDIGDYLISSEQFSIISAGNSYIAELRQTLKFLAAVDDTICSSAITERIDRDPDSLVAIMNRQETYSKSQTASIWFSHASMSTVEESLHPYKSSSFQRVIRFPGAEKLVITFDQRCCLAPDDKLTIFGGDINDPYQYEGSQTIFTITGEPSQSAISKSVEVSQDTITVSFETIMTSSGAHPDQNSSGASNVMEASMSVSAAEESKTPCEMTTSAGDCSAITAAGEEEVNKMNCWGWAFTVFAKGECAHNCALESINLDAGLEAAAATPRIEEANDFATSSSSTKELLIGIIERESSSASKLLEHIFPEESANPSSDAAELLHSNLSQSSDDECGAWSFVVESGVLEIDGAESVELVIKRFGVLTDRTAEMLFCAKISPLNTASSAADASSVYALCLLDEPILIECSGMGLRYEVYAINREEVQRLVKRTSLPPASAPTEQGTSDAGITSASSLSHGHAVSQLEAVDSNVTESSIPLIAPNDRGHVRGASDVNEMAVIPTADAATPLPAAESSSPIPMLEGWSCPMCTLINTLTANSCELCNTPRPDAAVSEDEVAPVTAPAAGWWCHACTFINPIGSTSCGACGTPTGGDANIEGDHASEQAAHTDAEGITGEDGQDTPGSLTRLFMQRSGSRLKGNGDVILLTMRGKVPEQQQFKSRCMMALRSQNPDGGVNSRHWRDTRVCTPLQLHRQLQQWSRAADNSLLEHLNGMKKPLVSSQSSLSTFSLPKKFLEYCTSDIISKDLLDIQCRVMLIEMFNKNLKNLLPLIDLSNEDWNSFGAMIRKNNRYLLMTIKAPLLEKALAATKATSGTPGLPAEIVLDNAKSLHSRDLNAVEPAESENCFVQAYRQLHSKDPVLFRYIVQGDRSFQITFNNEPGIDAGGVFREGVSRIVEDLFSEYFNLLVLCPNGQQAVHSNIDKYLPNSKHAGALAMSMFEFIGKLMAMSLRTKLCLPFEFPSLVWKKLVGEVATVEDLTAIDTISCRLIESIRSCESQNPDDEPITDDASFTKHFGDKLRFTCVGCDMVERELMKGGKDIRVTYSNRIKYCDGVVNARLNEFDEQIAAIAKGMGQVVPMRALLLFSAAQLEELVCGSPVFDIETWKQHTDVQGVSTQTVKLFWKVVETLSDKECAGLVRFAWGRSRLPPEKHWKTNMVLTNGGNAALPVAHTCFFSIELPAYTSEADMRHGLLTAIHYGVGGVLNS